MVSINDYSEERICIYNNEFYSVRDNGAIMRHCRDGKRKRKDDDVWTFGKVDKRTGYLLIAGERVHRIVAFAFLGEPPTAQHVVDHIDTNRQNNRPENLRWLTRLENVLNNPITKARVEYLCGSIEAFLENPSILRGHENIDSNFSWMKTVSREKARVSLENMLKWAKERPETKGGEMGDWIFQEKKPSNTPHNETSNIVAYNPPEDKETIINEEYFKTKSLTPNVIQINWSTPSEFPCCPQIMEDNNLEMYKQNLNEGSVFCKNVYYSSLVIDSVLVEGGRKLIVMTKNTDDKAIKPWALAGVILKDNIFYHISMGSFFSENGTKKNFTIAQGKEWTGGDVFDDYC